MSFVGVNIKASIFLREETGSRGDFPGRKVLGREPGSRESVAVQRRDWLGKGGESDDARRRWGKMHYQPHKEKDSSSCLEGGNSVPSKILVSYCICVIGGSAGGGEKAA